jgi:hypothetical protein
LPLERVACAAKPPDDRWARPARTDALAGRPTPQRNILGSSALQNPQVSRRVVGYLKAALDAIGVGPQAQMYAK